MKITSAVFKKGVVDDRSLGRGDTFPQIAFIGRSNVGKSSVINSLTGKKGLARSSSTPGRTQEINFFLINDAFYLVDLPGYGFAHGSFEKKDRILDLIDWYLFHPEITQKKVVLIVDAKVGMTKDDIRIFNLLVEEGKDIIIVANKTDKLKQAELKKSIDAIREMTGSYPVIPYSSEKLIGVKTLISSL